MTKNNYNLDLDLPQAAPPAANYVPFVISGNQIFISGQIPFLNGEIKHIGQLGKDYTTEQGIEAAHLCGLNILAQLNVALNGDLNKIVRCVKLGVFVNSTPDFTDQPKVANGVSDLMLNTFGENGRHARFAMGAAQLPLGVAVEVDAIFEIEI